MQVPILALLPPKLLTTAPALLFELESDDYNLLYELLFELKSNEYYLLYELL